MKINGKETNAKQFAYDGCHKIYLIDDDEDENEMVELGYEVLPIELLISIWEDACPLRFISDVKLTKSFVSQCEEAIFE